MKQWIDGYPWCKGRRQNDRRVGITISPASSTTTARLETALAQVHRFILGGILTKTAWESVTCVRNETKTLAASRQQQHVVGYLHINSYASLIWDLYTLQKKICKYSWKIDAGKTDLGTSLLGITRCMCFCWSQVKNNNLTKLLRQWNK